MATPTIDASEPAEASPLEPYDREAAVEIAEVKHPGGGPLSKAADALHRPLDRIVDAAFDTAVGEAVDRVLSEAVERIQDASSWTVRETQIVEKFRDRGHSVGTLPDAASLTLEQVDDVVGHLNRKYRLLAFAEGTVTGAAGLPGMLVDIPLVLGIAIRGTTELAAHYGFYPLDAHEKRYVLDLVSVAASPTLEMREASLGSLDEASAELGSRRSEAETVLAMQVVERLAESIVARLARGKIAQGIPLVGAFIGGGFNRWFVGQVMQLAEAVYRERFLVRRYGLEAVRRAQQVHS